jgi:hypothetical protein
LFQRGATQAQGTIVPNPNLTARHGQRWRQTGIVADHRFVTPYVPGLAHAGLASHWTVAMTIHRDVEFAVLKAEMVGVLRSRIDLHREMMRLPRYVRRQRWPEYYARLAALTERERQIQAAAMSGEPYLKAS